jgi:hypothetical protein
MDEPEERGESPEAGSCRSEIMGQVLEVGVNGEQAICADQGDDLVDGREEGNGVHGSQQTKDEEAGEPVSGGSLLFGRICRGFVVHRDVYQ